MNFRAIFEPMLWIVAIESFNLFSLSTFAFIKMHNTSQIFITFNLLIETWQIFKKICLHTAYFFRSTCSHSQLSVLSHQESWEEKCGKFCSAQWRLKTTKRKLKKLNKTERTENFLTVAANDTNEFKKIKFVQIQIFSKVKRYRFVWKC